MVLLPAEYDFTQNGTALRTGNYTTALWDDHRIYAANPLRYYDLDDSFHVVHDSVLLFDPNASGSGNTFFGIIAMRFNQEKSKLLCIKSLHRDVSIGNLQEIDLNTLSNTELLNSANSISSAVYLSNDSIIYYSYGSYSQANTDPEDAGYYLYVRSSGVKQFLLHHISSLGPGEIQNGFDIHPDHRSLLVPSVGVNRAPIVFEFNITTRKQDTIPITFNTSTIRLVSVLAL